MIIILVYNNSARKFERYCLEIYDSMPYTYQNSLTVKSFLGKSLSKIAWTSKDFLNSWSNLVKSNREHITVYRSFNRICEGGHIAQSQHYAGLAIDFARHLTPAKRKMLYDSIAENNNFSYLENLNHSSDHIHLDKRILTEDIIRYGYPELKQGDCGVYVLVLQDALNTIGITGSELDGFFGPLTTNSVKQFQVKNRLEETGVADAKTWRRITFEATGSGLTPTVLHMTN